MEPQHKHHTHGSRHGAHGDPGTQVHRLRRQVQVSIFPVTLRLHAPQAKAVSVAGSFANGRPHPMQRASDGFWQITLQLKRGRYDYRFLVDGVLTLDPKSFGTVSHPDGTRSSLLEVGY